MKKGGKGNSCFSFGRPKGERKPEMSLAPCAKHLSELINKPVAFVDDCIGPKVEEAVKALQPGDILMLENLRYHNEETKTILSLLNNGISCGRSHQRCVRCISTVMSASVVGMLIISLWLQVSCSKKEIDALSAAVVHPKTPMAAIYWWCKSNR